MVEESMYLEQIKTDRFNIKNFTINLVNQNYLNWFSDKDVAKFISFKPKNLLDLRQNVKKTLNKKNLIFLSIFSQKNKHIGNLKIHNIDFHKNEAWLGILIGNRKFRGIGLAREVIENVKIHLVKKKIYFLKLNVHRNNKAAISSYLKAGFIIVKKFKNFFTMSCNIYTKKIILGLAQLQSIYGVTNTKKKKLSIKESVSILNQFKNSQITELDTALTYPLNIDLLKFVKKNIYLNTKLLTSDIHQFKQFINYLNKIKRSKNIYINTIFIHDGNNLLTKNGSKMFNKILSLKKKEIIKKVGVSFHNFNNFKKIINSYKIDVVQIPYSAVDRRAKKYFKFLKQKNIEIQVRSIFLQGALLSKIKSNLKLSQIYQKMNLKKINDRANILFSFVLKDINIDKIIIGVRQVNELKMILNFNKFIFNNKIISNLQTNDLDVIDPLNWDELNYHEKK
tara:strand:+ start:6754 stop:8106 length:1353 start_codon:yes stop_codon:yes gene_type:complete